MSKKEKLLNGIEDIKRWAIDNASPSALHSLIQKIHEEIESMQEDNIRISVSNNEDTGGSTPPVNKGRG